MAAVSERALIVRMPISGSSAQNGIRPHLKATNSRLWLTGCYRIAKTCWAGAMLNLSGSVGGTGTPNTPAITSARDFSVYRPHIASLRTMAL